MSDAAEFAQAGLRPVWSGDLHQDHADNDKSSSNEAQRSDRLPQTQIQLETPLPLRCQSK